MSRKQLENRIEEIEEQQQTSDTSGIYFVEKTPDGTKMYVHPDTGHRLDKSEIPDSSILINLQ